MEWLLLYGTALLIGLLHALEPDHMAAVTAFAVRRPRPLASVRYGVFWAMGHGAAIVVVGSVLLIIGRQIPGGLTHVLERLVGVVLVGLGLWTLLAASRVHSHEHPHADGTTHVHVHSHVFDDRHEHGHGVTAVGLLHGLAGTAPAIAIIPLASAQSIAGGMIFLLTFAVGTAIGMGLYALAAGWVGGRAASHSAALARGIARFAGLATVGVGVLWLLR